MPARKPMDFPRWLEGLIVVSLLVMSVVEWRHGEWVWGGIFGVVGVAFGVGLLVRILTGEKRDGE